MSKRSIAVVLGLALILGLVAAPLLSAGGVAPLIGFGLFLVFLAALGCDELGATVLMTVGIVASWTAGVMLIAVIFVPWSYSSGALVRLSDVLAIIVALDVAIFPSAIAVNLLLWWLVRLRRRRRTDRCSHCGYPRRGLPTRRCPECGEVADNKRGE